MIHTDNNQAVDVIASKLRHYAQNVLVIVFGLLPLFFIPSSLAPFEYTKILIVVIGVVAALVLYSLSALRDGKIIIGFSRTLLVMWGVALIAIIAAMLSGDTSDSLIGETFSTHSAIFVALLALVMSVWVIFGVERAAVMRLYIVLSVSALLLVSFHLVRLFVGAETLSLGIFGSAISTPVGNWNDLALFLGLVTLLSLVATEQLSLTRGGRWLFGVIIVISLMMLTVINFFTVWLVLGFVSLIIIVYSLGKDRLSGAQPSLIGHSSATAPALIPAIVVFVISVVFVIGGADLGAVVAKQTNISYIEVRPSFEATTDIARAVYRETPWLGMGPNRFTEAWRLHKDPTINTTLFWNTDFNAGNGYISSFFVTTGVLGGLAWLTFLGLFAVRGIRILLAATEANRMWYFIAVSSFVGAVYIWGMSLVYVPGAVILLLGALCTGISLAAGNALLGRESFTFSFSANRRTGFMFVAAVIVVIIGSVATLYKVTNHYAAVYAFNESQAAANRGDSLEVIEAATLKAFQRAPSDVYARRIAEVRFAQANMLAATPFEVRSAEQNNQLQETLRAAISAAREAVILDPTEPANHTLLGNLFVLFFTNNIDGAYAEAKNSLERARELNPHNPIPYLALAELEGAAGNVEAARNLAETSVRLKSNYTNALFFLSQLDIAAGNVESAIAVTQSIIALEPNNAARYYQLGVLELAQQNLIVAEAAFIRAIQLDSNYANARYLLALTYDATGKTTEARAELVKVLELNPGNAEVTMLIDRLDTEGTLALPAGAISQNPPVTDGSEIANENGTVITTEAPASRLVVPVNTPPTPATAPSNAPPTASEALEQTPEES